MGLVLAELDRVNSEKRTYQQKLKLAEEDTDLLHDRIAAEEHGEMIHACDRDVKDAR